MITNATIQQLENALDVLQNEYNYPLVAFQNIEQKTSNRRQFTLKAVSKERGARTSASGRNMPKASWHVHGYFFDILMNADKNVFIRSAGNLITFDNGNWTDWNVGSMYSPCMFSSTSIE